MKKKETLKELYLKALKNRPTWITTNTASLVVDMVVRMVDTLIIAEENSNMKLSLLQLIPVTLRVIFTKRLMLCLTDLRLVLLQVLSFLRKMRLLLLLILLNGRSNLKLRWLDLELMLVRESNTKSNSLKTSNLPLMKKLRL